MIKMMQKKMMYILGTNTAAGGFECRVLLLYVTLQGGVEWRKKKLCAKNETSLWENTPRVCWFLCHLLLSSPSSIYRLDLHDLKLQNQYF